MVEPRTSRSVEAKLRKALCRASHAQRREGFEEAFRQAIAEHEDGWALLARAFAYWVDQDYDRIDKALHIALGDLAPARKTETYKLLTRLLFAHADRRQADVRMDESRRSRDEGETLLAETRRLLERARAEYQTIEEAKRAPLQIKAVCAHSLGNLSALQLRVDLANGQFADTGRFRYIPSKWDEAEGHYKKATIFLPGYAPPYNRLATLEYWRAGFAPKDIYVPPDNRQLSHLHQAVEYAQDAIDAARHDVPGGQVSTYAPPFLLKARATYFLRTLSPQQPDPRGLMKEVTDLLKQAVECSPYDEWPLDDIESFVKFIRGKRRCYEPWGPYDLLRIRLSYPAGAMDADLKRYFRIPRSKTAGLNELVVLRRWSSYSPLLAREGHETVGGGYLLQWHNHRVAIDPGVGFIRNVHELGHAAYNFDTLIMTHQHVDHCAEMEPLLSLFKLCGEEGPNGQKQVSVLYSTSGAQRWASSLLRNSDVCERETVPRDSGAQPVASIDTDKSIHVTPTPLYYHQDAVDESVGRDPTGFGLVFDLVSGRAKARVGITSDTGYVGTEGNGICSYFKDCHVVVLHVSTVKDLAQQLNASKVTSLTKKHSYFRDVTCSNEFYRKHLGFWGTVCLICDLALAWNGKSRPPLILLSEFGEEMLGSRAALLDEVQCRVARLKRNGNSIGVEQAKRIWIADVGTRVGLAGRRKGAVLCQFGGQVCNMPARRSFELQMYHGDITMTHRGWADRRIVHLCTRHSRHMSNEKRGRWPLIGKFTHFKEIPRCACLDD